MARPRRQAANGGDPVGAAQVVERTLNQTKPGLDEHRTRISRFNASYDIWRGNTGQTQRTQANDWQSRLRIKYGMQVIDQALVNLVQGIPKAKVTARRPEDEDKADAMQRLLGYYADLDHIAEQEPVVCQQALIYGISPAKTHWLYCEQEQTQFAPVIDPETGAVAWQPRKGKVVTEDRPTMEPWDAYSIWWDPVARNVDSASYIVLESWKTRDELEAGRYNAEDGTGQWQNLDLLYASGDGRPEETSQNRMLPQPLGTYTGRFRIWEVWRKTPAGVRLTVIGNRNVLLKDGPSPYWMAGYPITISNSRPDLFRIEGVSEAELVDHLQQAMWTVHNLRMEQLKSTVMRGGTVRATAGDLSSYVMRPNYLWVVNDHDDVAFHDRPNLPPEAYKETDTLLSLLQYVTGITPYVGGASATASGVDQTTATGVSLLTESASRLLQFKAGIIHQRTWQRTFEQWGMLTKQFLRREIDVRIEGPHGAEWSKAGPGEANGDFDIRIEAGDESASRSQERADAVAFANAIFPFVQLGAASSKPAIEKIGKAFNIQNPETLFPPPGQPPLASPTLNGGGQQPALLGGPHAPQQPLAAHPPLSILAGNQR